MPASQAATILLYVASACIILLTIGAGVAAFLLFKVIKDVRDIVRFVRGEIQMVKNLRTDAFERLRFFQKWLRIMGTRIMR